MDEMRNSHPVLLYDGLCGFCDKSIQLILRHDRRKTLRFAPLQSSYAKAIIGRHPELQNIDSVILVERARARERNGFLRALARPCAWQDTWAGCGSLRSSLI